MGTSLVLGFCSWSLLPEMDQLSSQGCCSFRRFGYVDFSSAEDLDKALQMSGKKLMGSEIKLEKAKSKEAMKENKKGTAHNSEYVWMSKKSHNVGLECWLLFCSLMADLPALGSV